MRAHILLSLTATLASAYPGGWEGGGQHDEPKGPKKDGHGRPDVKNTSCEPTPTPEPLPEPVYTKPTTWSKSKDYPKPSSTFTCPTTCRLDFHGTFLQYPTMVEYTPVYAQTINQFITEFSDGSPGQSSEETITAPPAPTAAPLTWTAFGVELTFPTTYVAYTSIDYATNIALTAQQSCLATESPLQFPTIWESLIADPTSIQQPGDIPPATIIQWIDSLPTVQNQLGGHVCDPANGGIAPFVPTATVTSATTIDGNTRIVHTTTVSVSSTTTPPPPPPPSTTSSGPVQQTVNAAVFSKRPDTGSWLGSFLAAMLLVL